MILLLCAGVLCHIAFACASPPISVNRRLLRSPGLTAASCRIDPAHAPANNYLGIVLYAIVVITCIFTFLQDKATADVLASIKGMMASSTAVIRDGTERRIDPAELVPGDLVRLCLGDRVPADLRIIATYDLRTECSSLTGEPDAIPATVVAKHEAPIEARNIVFSSSLVMNGEGYGVVIKTGDNTMIGSIASLAAGSGHVEETLLEQEVHRFVNFIAVMAIIMAFVLFGIGMGRKPQNFIDSFVNGFIVVLVANVPEGLPATVTSCLSITAKRMAARNVLIKRTNIIESLGSATVIASDKTGTLTQNRMTVENLWYNRSVWNAYAGGRPDLLEAMSSRSASANAHMGSVAEDEGADESGAALPSRSAASNTRRSSLDAGANMTVNSFTISGFGSAVSGNTVAGVPGGRMSWDKFSGHAKLMTIAGICNRARYEDSSAGALGSEDRKILGDASDAGLLRYCDKIYPTSIARRVFPKVFEIPFNSVNKWSLAVVPDPAAPSKTHVVFMKGAPEIILARCSTFMYHNSTRPLDDEFREAYTSAYERFGSCGERVLGFAYKVIPAGKPEAYATDEGKPPTDGLTFCGLISLVDPPRDGVADAIAVCRKAGIKVTMVTGDHPLTAEAIARKVNIITRCTPHDVALEDGVPEEQVDWADPRVEAIVIKGSQINSLTLEQWDTILSKRECVFARTSPQQKLLLVENYQRRGEVVAVTGDGVNDSPALKRAQIGVAMGSINASEVAREAADIILLDDNFASIVHAIEEGRTLFDNLKKTIAYTLAHLLPEIVPILLNLAFSFPLAMNGLMILTIDLLTEQGPAISLAYEESEYAVMSRPPRNLVTDRLVTGPSLFYSYIVAGASNALISMYCFFLVYIRHGIPLSQLTFILDSTGPNPFTGGNSTTAANYFAKSPFVSVGNTTVNNVTVTRWTSGGTEVLPLVASNGGKVYDAVAQWNIFSESQCAWYLTLIFCQVWHIWNCRTRTTSIFKQGLFTNVVTMYGVGCEVAIMAAVIYIPAFQNASAFQTYPLHGIYWLPHLIYLGWIFSYNETVKCVGGRCSTL